MTAACGAVANGNAALLAFPKRLAPFRYPETVICLAESHLASQNSVITVMEG